MKHSNTPSPRASRATTALFALIVGSGSAHAAVEVLVSSSVSGDQASVTCMAREANLANNMTVPVRRGGKNTIRLQETGISDKLTAVVLNNCPSCASSIRRSGDTARVEIEIPASTPVGTGPSVTLRLRGTSDPVINLAVNPAYSISTNLMPQVGTIRKGDAVNVAGRELDAGTVTVEPSCVALVGRSATAMQLKYNCEVNSGSQGAIAQVKYFHNAPAAQRCELSHDWRIANFDANAKPDLTPAPDQFGTKPFRPVTAGTNNIDASFCRDLPRAGSECARIENRDGSFTLSNNCVVVPAQGFVPVPALSFAVKNIGGAPSAPTVTKVFDGAGRELVSSNTPAVPNGQSTFVKVRDAKSVRATASGPTGCQLDVVGLIASPFDPDAFIVKVDTGNALTEGGAGRANNEARF